MSVVSVLDGWLEIVSFVCAFVTYFIYLPLCINWYMRYMKYKDHQYIKKRDSISILTVILVFGIVEFIIGTLPILQGMGVIGIDNTWITMSLLGFENIFLVQVLAHFLHLFYKVKKAHVTKDWKKYFTDATPETKGFLFNDTNSWMLRLIGLIISLIFSGAMMTVVGIYETDTVTISNENYVAAVLAIELIVLVILMILFMILVRGLIISDDSLYFGRQSKLFGINMFTFLIGYIIILLGILLPNFSLKYGLLLIDFIPLYIIILNGNLMMSIIGYPLRKAAQSDDKILMTWEAKFVNILKCGCCSNNSTAIEQARKNLRDEQNKQVNKLTVSNILSGDAEMLERFADHVASEFTSENLIFLLFMSQFQTFLYQINYLNRFNSNGAQGDGSGNLSEAVPISPIFTVNNNNNNNNGNNTEQVCKIVKKIYMLHIDPASDLEVNISASQSKWITESWKSCRVRDDPDQINYQTFENMFPQIWSSLKQAEKEIYNLVTKDTLNRFKKAHCIKNTTKDENKS